MTHLQGPRVLFIWKETRCIWDPAGNTNVPLLFMTMSNDKKTFHEKNEKWNYLSMTLKPYFFFEKKHHNHKGPRRGYQCTLALHDNDQWQIFLENLGCKEWHICKGLKSYLHEKKRNDIIFLWFRSINYVKLVYLKLM